MASKNIACLGDGATHSGSIVTSGQDGSFTLNGLEVAVEGARFSCNIKKHGTTDITPASTTTGANGKAIIGTGSVAGCGAVITPPDRKAYIG